MAAKSGNYRPQAAGLKQLGMSKGMAEVALAHAEKLSGNANAVGDSTYEAVGTVVRVGWANEPRRGAVVREVQPHWRDYRDRVLLRVAEAMEIRGRRR